MLEGLQWLEEAARAWTREVLNALVDSAKREPKIIITNALVPAKGLIFYTPISAEVAKEILSNKTEIFSFVGHPSTAKVLSELSGKEIQVNRSEYKPGAGDIVLIVRLKKRLPAPQEAEVKLEDLEFALARYAVVLE